MSLTVKTPDLKTPDPKSRQLESGKLIRKKNAGAAGPARAVVTDKRDLLCVLTGFSYLESVFCVFDWVFPLGIRLTENH